MPNLLISIIIPIYNVSAYIDRCLQSVMNQTYANCEVILVDDCGTDDSVAKCEYFISRYHLNWTLLHHKRNRGLSAARNTGTDIATGDFVLYLDSDDELMPNCVQDMVTVVEKYPMVEIVQGNTMTMPYDEWYDIKHYRLIDYTENREWIVREFFKDRQGYPVTVWNKLIKYSFIKENKLSFVEGLIHEDHMWMLHVIRMLSKIAFVHEYTYVHYITSNSIMTSLDKCGHLPSWKIILQEATQIWDKRYAGMQMHKYLYHFLCRIDSFSMSDVREIAAKYSTMAFHMHNYELGFILYRLSKQAQISANDFFHEYFNGYIQIKDYNIINYVINLLRVKIAMRHRLRQILGI